MMLGVRKGGLRCDRGNGKWEEERRRKKCDGGRKIPQMAMTMTTGTGRVLKDSYQYGNSSL